MPKRTMEFVIFFINAQNYIFVSVGRVKWISSDDNNNNNNEAENEEKTKRLIYSRGFIFNKESN